MKKISREIEFVKCPKISGEFGDKSVLGVGIGKMKRALIKTPVEAEFIEEDILSDVGNSGLIEENLEFDLMLKHSYEYYDQYLDEVYKRGIIEKEKAYGKGDIF